MRRIPPPPGAAWLKLTGRAGRRRWALVDKADYAAVVAAGPWHLHTPSKRRGKPKSKTRYARTTVYDQNSVCAACKHPKPFHWLGRSNACGECGCKRYMPERRSVYLHRWLWERWRKPPTEHIDHDGGDGLDCRYIKLRPASHAENQRARMYKNKLGLKGVRRDGNRYIARITLDGHRRLLGKFATADAAAKAYDRAARELHGAFARTNSTERAA